MFLSAQREKHISKCNNIFGNIHGGIYEFARIRRDVS